MRRDHPDARPLPDSGDLPAPAADVVAALQPLLTDNRLQRIDAVLDARVGSVVPVLDGLIDPHNIAAVLRSADAFGIQQVHLIAGSVDFLASKRVAQGTERWLDVVQHDSPASCADALHADGFQVYIAAMDGDLRPEQLAQIPRVAIVFGNEHSGVSERMAQLADGSYRIPMCGFVESLNVSVATAITLRAAREGRAGDLDPERRVQLRARFMMLSVDRADEIVAEHQRRHT